MTYKFGTSIAVDSQNRPHVAFYNEKDQALNYATRDGAGWRLEAVDGDGDTGKFASIAIDADDNPRISHYAQKSPNGGEVRYSTFDGSGWSTSAVGEIDGVDIGFIGARNLTQLQLDGQGRPVVAYSGSDVLRIARLEGSEWTVQTVVERSNRPLGQQTSFRLAADGTAHVAYFDVEKTNPLGGTVHYAKGVPGG